MNLRLGVSVASQCMLRAFGQRWLWFTIQCWDVWFSALGQRGSGLPSTSGPSWVSLLHGFRLGVTQSPGLACLGRPIWQFTGRLTGNSWGTALCAVGLFLWTIGRWLITLVHVVVGGAGGGASLPPLGRTLASKMVDGPDDKWIPLELIFLICLVRLASSAFFASHFDSYGVSPPLFNHSVEIHVLGLHGSRIGWNNGRGVRG